MKLKWLFAGLFFFVICAPFILSDNTGRSYLGVDDLRDPATIINGYQRLMLSLPGKTKGKDAPQLQRWIDGQGVVHYADADSKGVPEDSEKVDFSQIKNTNFIAMEGHGSTVKAVLVYGVLVVVLLIAAFFAWHAVKTVGRKASGLGKIDWAANQYTAIEFKPGSNASHTILGVAEDASPEEIKRAYRKKMSQFHPDKVANMSEAVRDQALQQAKVVNVAYKELSEQPK